jgi:mono/diheme cytochrome c family protein
MWLNKPYQHRLWRLLAAAVLLVFSGLGLTEATGVSCLAGTVIRVSMPDGTLVVEVDDPQVKVTIEGDGGIVITGAGAQEVRLKPGSYRVLAGKDGKASTKQLVNISRAGKQVVKVSVEPSGAPVQAKLTPEEEKKLITGLYNRHCIRCHGVDGRGVWDIPKVQNFTDAKWQASRSNAEIARTILDGRGGTPEKRRDSLKLPPPSKATGVLHWAIMPSFQGILTPEQAASMARFLRGFAPSTEALKTAATKIYATYCLACHDGTGKGNPMIRRTMPELPDFTSAKWQKSRTDRDFAQSLLMGKGKFHPPMGDRLGKVDVKEMVGLVRAFQVLSSNDPVVLRNGMVVFRHYCMVCHGPDGKGTQMRPALPPIPDFTNPDFHKERSDARLLLSILDGKGRLMPAQRGRLTEDQARNLVAYIRAFQPADLPGGKRAQAE